MAQICDNTSVGMIFKKDGRILMIERKIYNPGWALPAGHQDGDTQEDAAKKESFEEVGFIPSGLKKVYEKNLPNFCNREGGTHHKWTVFEVLSWTGELKPSEDEVKNIAWLDKNEIKKLAQKLENFASKLGLVLEEKNLPLILKTVNKDKEWKSNPGLEPPMYFIFKQADMI